MKTRTLLFSLVTSLALSSAAWAASMAPMQVKVTNSANKVVYKGSTDASGAFATPQLPAGQYVVQFNSKSSPKGGPFALSLNAGKAQTVADSVSGSKFSGGGVAMKIELASAASMNGQVSHAGAHGTAMKGSTPVPADGVRTEKGVKVKYEHGKKFIWVESPMSTLGGHWAPADSREAQSVESPHH